MQLANSLPSTHHSPYMPDNWKFAVHIYLLTLSVLQMVRIGLLANNELERMWWEATSA
jgi:hypothetical protein